MSHSGTPRTRISLEGKIGIAVGIIGVLATVICTVVTLITDNKERIAFLRWSAAAGAAIAVLSYWFFQRSRKRQTRQDDEAPSGSLIQVHFDYVAPTPTKVISGREKELDSLWTFLMDERAETGGLYWLLGQRGIGKTAILDDIDAALQRRPDAQYVLRGRCKEGGEQSPFFSIQVALINFFADGHNSGVLETLKHVAPRGYAMANPGAGLDETEGAHARAAAPSQTSPIPELCAFIDRLRELRPVVLILDDAHWLDSETSAFLRMLFSGTPRRNLRGIVAARPEGMAENKTLAALYRDLQRESAHLEPLNENGVRDMLRQMLGEGQISGQLASAVSQATGGYPLAVENAVTQLKKHRMIQNGSGPWRLCAADAEVRERLQGGLESLVASSFADLDPKEQLLLMAGSVQGPEFDSRVVAQATGVASGECETVLRQLSDTQQFIQFLAEEQTAAHVPSLHFKFLHWVFQDSVRKRLTPTAKLELSGKVAAAIEAEFPDRAAQHPDDLAGLFAAAGNEAKEKEYRARAARQQLRLGGYAAAIVSARRAAGLFETNQASGDAAAYRDNMVVLGVCLTALNGYANEEAQEAYRKSLGISAEAKLPEHFPSRYGVWMYHLVRGRMAEAKGLATEMLNLAMQDERLAPDRSQALWAMGVTQYFMGEVPAAKLNFEAGIQSYREEWHAYYASCYVLDPGVANRYLLARALVFLGYPDQARTLIRESLDLARKLNHVESLAFALVSAGVVHAFYSEIPEVKRYSAELMEISNGNELRQHRPWAHILRGWASGVDGDLDPGIQELLDGLARYEAMGARLALAGFYAMEADLRRRQGSLDDEERVLDKATKHMEDTGQRYYWTEFLRLRIQIQRKRGKLDARQTAVELGEARRLAAAMQSRAAELRIVTDLAIALGETGDSATGSGILENFLAAYPEGRDTADAKRAIQALADLKSMAP